MAPVSEKFMNTILIIEDDPAINKMLALNLSVSGYKTASAYDGEEALSYIQKNNSGEEHFDLALVNVMLPKIDGFALMEPLRQAHIPVIYLTAKGDLESKLKGLKSGAEDYMVKPFEILELLVRMEKVLARNQKNQTIWQIDAVIIDANQRKVARNGQLIPLTPMEFDLLLLLVKHQNMALSRERLLSEVWGIFYEGGTRTVDVHIAQLRKKTGLTLVSVPKIGYRLEVSP